MILKKYLELQEFKLDEQLLKYNTDILDKISINALLAQFKYCRKNSINNRYYKILKKYLSQKFGKDFIDRLEGIEIE
jgi:hypothetical protein